MKRRGGKAPNGQLFRDVVWGVQHDAFHDRLGRSLLRAWRVGECSPTIVRQIQRKLRPLRSSDAFGELNPFRKPQLDNGEIVIGWDDFKERIHIFLQWLNAGLLMLGNTGASKTNLAKMLLLELAAFVDGLWVTDMYKREIRHLRPLIARLNKNLIIARLHQLKVNLLQADGDPRGHLPMILDILQRVLDLPGRAMAILRAVCHQLYLEYNVYRGNCDSWPTVFDVYERIRTTRSLNASAKEALLDRLGTFLVSLTPGVGAYRLAWRPSDLSKHFVDFEFHSTGEQVKAVLLNYFLFSVLRSRVASGAVNAPMNFWCLFEDAQRYFSARGETRDITASEEIAGLIRGTGTGLAFTAQTMAGLPSGLIPNLASKCMCRLGSHSDYISLGADMGMSSEQIQWAKLNLRPGVSIWSLSEGPWRLPFIAYTPELKIPSVVTDDDASQSMEALDALPTVPAPEFADWEPNYVITLCSGNDSDAGSTSLSDVELRYLDAVVSAPGKSTSFYSRKTSISGKRAVEIRTKLVRAGFIREHKVATGKRGRNAILLEPLPAGSDAIANAVQ